MLPNSRRESVHQPKLNEHERFFGKSKLYGFTRGGMWNFHTTGVRPLCSTVNGRDTQVMHTGEESAMMQTFHLEDNLKSAMTLEKVLELSQVQLLH